MKLVCGSKIIKKSFALVLTALMLSGLIITNSVFAKSLLDEITQRGKIKIGSTLKYPPQMYVDSSGKPAGYDVELMRMLAKDMKV